VALVLRCLSILIALSAVNANASRTWLVRGSDLNERYGGLLGCGGLEAGIDESSGAVTGVISDAFGHVVARVNGSAVTWSSTRSLGYGPQPGSWSPPIEPGRNPLESFAWRGKYADGSGLICLHARYYDPTRGRFISPDPLGHPATADLYSAFAGNPIDHFDPDGMLSVNTARGGWAVGADLSAKAGWGNGSGLGFEDYRLSGLDGARAGLTVSIGALTGGAGGAASLAGRVAYAGLGAAGGNIVTDFAIEATRGQLPSVSQLHTSSTVGLITGPAGPIAEEGLGAAYRVYNTIRSSSKPASYALGDITIQGHPAGVGPGAMYVGELPKNVSPFQVGRFDDLQRASQVGDDLALHHAGQKHAMQQIIPGYNPQTAPAIAVPTVQHRAIPNLTGPYTGTARDLLARDIRNLRNYTDAPNSSLHEVIQLNKEMYPNAFKKP
jgi:RHS repeat-associated protein